MDLTKVTGRVIFVTPMKYIFGSEELKTRFRRSDVKVLKQSKLLEVSGTNTVEKVKIHDLDEDEKYELFVDAVILP